MKRKVFLQKLIGSVIAIIPIYGMVGCSSSDDGGGQSQDPDPDPDAEANCTANGTNAAIGTNHGHTLTVSKEDVTAGAQKTYSIQGSSEHDHQVTLSEANFNDLKDNKAITVTSTSGGGHTHSVNVSCA